MSPHALRAPLARDVAAGPGDDRGARASLPRRSLWVGGLGAAGLALLYAAVVGIASGSIDHLVDQVRTDWYLLLPIAVGFGVQVGLLSELRRRRRMHGLAAGAGAAGARTSTVGMVACCAHHIADLAPFVGATAAATFLYEQRVAFMVVGLGINAVAITVAARRLRRSPAPSVHGEEEVCAVG
ncbi:hypothetical protein HRbin12_01751 [bacterium HR12]|nr:hypothetical protein HRbin12_01751 [bacterium HR12]